MIGLFLAAAALAVVSLALLLPGLFRPKAVRAVDMAAENVAVARDRLDAVAIQNATSGVEDSVSPEIQAALLEDLAGPDYQLENDMKRGRWTALGLLLAAPLLAAGLYIQLGDDRWASPPTPQAQPGQQHSAGDIQQLLARLEQSLEENPENADGWAIAGRTYMVMNDFAKAENAYATVHKLVGDDPDILTAWADASLMRNGGRYTPEIAERISRALALDPAQLNALWIGAMGANSAGDGVTANEYLERLRPLLADNPEALDQLARQMNAPRQTTPADSADSVDSADSAASDTPISLAPAAIEVEVSLEQTLAQGLSPDTTVFVFARALQGPPMPLAARKLSVGDLPLTLTLDDSQAMVAEMNLSSQERVAVTARISLSGSPTAQSGDPTSESVETPTRDGAPIKLLINRLSE